ncbi:MAG: hypothetical protein MRZ79_12320 [Bacteroidia bacterium]|nr:hypothetical protein [Bacteroidia bacterium]
MEFTSADVKKLYGNTFFLVEEAVSAHSQEQVSETIAKAPEEQKEEPKVEVAKVESPPLKVTAESIPSKEEINPYEKYLGVGPTSNWKLKPNSSLALIVLKSEFADREAMANLKNLLVDAGIDTSKIGFGIVEDGKQGWNFSDMPVSQGILFLSFPERLPSPTTWRGKLLYPAAPMSLIMNDDRYAKAMSRLLQRVQASME